MFDGFEIRDGAYQSNGDCKNVIGASEQCPLSEAKRRRLILGNTVP